MKVFLAIGNEELEKSIKEIDSITVVDSESSLEIILGLLEFIKVDYLILNRLLDTDGTKLLEVVKKASESSIKVIMLVGSFEGFEEKKVIASLVNEGVHSYLKISEFNKDKLLHEMSHYPETFDFNLLKADDTEVQEERIMEKVVHVGFTKKILTVWENAEFGCELAYIISKMTDYSVLLIDMDLLAPKADLYLNIKKNPENIKTQGIYSDSGFNIIMDSIEKNIYSPELMMEACIKKKGMNNLYILTGNYNLENYEYFSSGSMKKLLEKAYQSFDITILLVNKFIYDEFTFIGLQKSDFNLIPINADYDKLREYNRYLIFLRDKQQIPLEKSKFIAFDYYKGIDLDEKIIREITGNQYIGSIRHNRRRRKYRNLKAIYAPRMDRDTLADYLGILEKLDIVPKHTIWNRLQEKMEIVFRRLRHIVRFMKRLKRGGPIANG